jgi:hypothetical protein
MPSDSAVDVVYVLGSGSKWYNNEIRYSIRSIQQNLSGYRKIFVVGADPGFLTGVIHVPCNDIYRGNADGNIIHKILHLIKTTGNQLTDEFVFMSDDQFFLMPFDARDLKLYYCVDMAQVPDTYFPNLTWRNRLKHTRDYLIAGGKTAYNFDVHIPVLFNKELFSAIFSSCNYATGAGYTIVSVYANNLQNGVPVKLSGEKAEFFRPMSLADINYFAQSATFLAINDSGLNPSMKEFLENQFPKPSIYETMIPLTEKSQEIYCWLDDPSRTFDAGVALYLRYGINRYLKISFTHAGDTVHNRTRLVTALCAISGYPYLKGLSVKNDFVSKINAPVVPTNTSDSDKEPVEFVNGSYRIKKHPTVNYDKLPQELKVKFDENIRLNREISSNHAVMAGSSDQQQRSDLLKRNEELLKVKHENWDAIDNHLATAPKDSNNEVVDTAQAVDHQKKITAARSYISRNKASKDPKIQQKVQSRIQELKSYGITVKT